MSSQSDDSSCSRISSRKVSSRAFLAVAALGVVFGDIGTSPLYVLRAVFSEHNNAVPLTHDNIIAVISFVIWLLIILVSFKYVVIVLRASDGGEGGGVVLASLVRKHILKGYTGALGFRGIATFRGISSLRKRAVALMIVVSILCAALFFGDSVITPVISVLSAVEGVKVAVPALSHRFIVPIALVILTVLFAAQRYGTSKVGRIFGPVMVVWFVTIGLIGIPHIVAHPEILMALSPHPAIMLAVHHPWITFLALGALVLAVTGGEALYADMSHFGAPPIRLAWFALVLPALLLNYLGQGALLLHDAHALADPFITLVPEQMGVFLVILSTIATIIASQAVISGTFSCARQASRLGFLPHLRVIYTSEKESGQIYVPAVNILLYVAVVFIMLLFQSSDRLAGAYGLAVSTYFLITTILITVLMRVGWKWHRWQALAFFFFLCVVEVPLFAANIAKFWTGGWLPIIIAIVMVFVMTTWHHGELIVRAVRMDDEGTLADFLTAAEKAHPRRIPGTAIYPHSLVKTAPYSLRTNTRVNRVLHDHVIILSIKTEVTPYVPIGQRVTVEKIPCGLEGIVHMTIRYGFFDIRNIPATLEHFKESTGLASWKLESAQWFLSHMDIEVAREKSPRLPLIFKTDVSEGCIHDHDEQCARCSAVNGMSRWRKKVFVMLARTSASPMWTQFLPRARTTTLSRAIEI